MQRTVFCNMQHTKHKSFAYRGKEEEEEEEECMYHGVSYQCVCCCSMLNVPAVVVVVISGYTNMRVREKESETKHYCYTTYATKYARPLATDAMLASKQASNSSRFTNKTTQSRDI